MSTNQTRCEWMKLSTFSATTFASFDLQQKTTAQNNSNKLIKLTSNENPYSFSLKVKQAILDSVGEGNR